MTFENRACVTFQNKDVLQISGEWTDWCCDFSIYIMLGFSCFGYSSEELIIKFYKIPFVLGYAFV